MTTATKTTLIEKLTERFAANVAAKAAAINEVLTAATYADYFAEIVADSATPAEALLAWSIRRGEVWENF